MRILLITSRLARRTVEEGVREAQRDGCREHEVEILTLPVDVISLLDTVTICNVIERVLGSDTLRNYDLIIVPGLVRGSARELEKRFGVKAVKGFIHASMTKNLLCMSSTELLNLSPDLAADYIVSQQAKARLANLELDTVSVCTLSSCICLRNVCITSKPPPIRVVGLLLPELIRRGIDFVEHLECADVVGLAVDDTIDVDDAKKILKRLEIELGKPLAIDCYEVSKLRLLAREVDLIVNIPLQLVEEIREDLKHCAVSIPVLTGASTEDKLRNALTILNRAKEHGFERVVLDLVLNPPLKGFVYSLETYRRASQILPCPLQATVNNVVEYLDADSIGIAALTTCIALECGISLVVVYEGVGRSFNLINEVSKARDLAMLALHRNTMPRDLGIDLFLAKEAHPLDIELTSQNINRVIEVEKRSTTPRPDPMGVFKVRADKYRRVIEVLYMGRKGVVLLRGRDPLALAYEAIDRGYVSTLHHAAYLGHELARAHVAIELGRSYVQDFQLVKRIKCRD